MSLTQAPARSGQASLAAVMARLNAGQRTQSPMVVSLDEAASRTALADSPVELALELRDTTALQMGERVKVDLEELVTVQCDFSVPEVCIVASGFLA